MPRATLRLFFALWPDTATREALAAIARDARERCGGRSPPPGNLHLTLAFLGSVAAARLPELRSLADAVVAAPFDMEMVHLGWWRAQRLAWAAPRECPDALTALHLQLTDRLRHHGFQVERRAFKPHVTLLRDVATPPALSRQTMAPVCWPVRQFALACSEPASGGVRYRLIDHWPLNAARL